MTNEPTAFTVNPLEPPAMDTNVLVSVVNHPTRGLEEVSSDLKRAGMRVVDVLTMSRIVTGSVDEEKIPMLRKVPDVASVELDTEFSAH